MSEGGGGGGGGGVKWVFFGEGGGNVHLQSSSGNRGPRWRAGGCRRRKGCAGLGGCIGR